MRIVLVICCLHLWWGVSLLIGIPLPRPFGAFEPFFMLPYATHLTIGIAMTIVGFLPILVFHLPETFWCRFCMMVPQQLVLGWGFLVGSYDAFGSLDGRSWYSLGYTGALFFGHAWELSEILLEEIIRKRASNGQ